MEKRSFEIYLLIFLLILNVGLVIYIFSGGISGFVISENEDYYPSDFLKKEDIIADNGSVTFFLKNPVLSNYEDTGSMVPFLGKDSTGVGFKAQNHSQINVGDVISFRSEEGIIVHRVVEKGRDEIGIYFVTKGDNNGIDDGRIRFESVDSVLVAIIY